MNTEQMPNEIEVVIDGACIQGKYTDIFDCPMARAYKAAYPTADIYVEPWLDNNRNFGGIVDSATGEPIYTYLFKKWNNDVYHSIYHTGIKKLPLTIKLTKYAK